MAKKQLWAVYFFRGPAGANEEVTMDAVKFTSTMTGTHHVAISFQSNELTDIHGECTVTEPSP